MKKNETIKKVTKLVSPLALLFSVPIIAASCVETKNDDKKNDDKITTQKPISGNVKYIAIGDDYGIGNNNSENYENNNFYNEKTSKDGVIGVSYASYLANSILILNDSKTKLESYENFSLLQSTSNDWLHLLNPEKYNKNNFETMVNFNNSLSNKNKERIKILFKNSINYDNKKLIETIEKSNFLTLSVGFNDIYKKNELLSLLFSEYNTEKDFKDALNNYKILSLKRIEELKSNYLKIINEIKKINEKININLTGYISPLLHFSLIDNQHENAKIINLITSKLNKTIMEVAKESKVNYYSFSNAEYMNNNAIEFSSDLLSFFPSNKAYKKLAQDIFSKMSISAKEYNKLFNFGNSNTEISNHMIALDFAKKATDIKTTIVGIIGKDVETHKKSYPFEKKDLNNKIIISEQNNKFSRKILLEFKSYFSDEKNLNLDNIKQIINSISGFFGISQEKNKNWLMMFYDLAINNENKKSFINLINEILSSKQLQDILDEANNEASELIIKKSYQNIKIKEIRDIFTKHLRNTSNSYKVFKSVFNKEFISKKENKNFLREKLPLIIKVIFSDKLISSIFPGDFSIIWKKMSKNQDVLSSFDLAINKFVELGIENSEKYFSEPKLEGFFNLILKDNKKEIINFFKSIINWFSNNQNDFEKILNSLVNGLKDNYSIKDNNKLDDIKYFVKNIFLSLNNFKYSYEFLDLFVETIILNKGTKNILGEFAKNLIFNDKDSNKNNKLFFALISNNPNIEKLDSEKYDLGMKYLGLSLLKVESIISIENLGSLINDKTRNSILKLLDNISNNKDNELNERGKKYLKSFSSLFIDEIAKNDSLLNQLLDNLGDYIVIHPLTNWLKKSGLEQKILNSNPNFKSVEDFIKNSYKSIYKSINNKKVIEQIKKIAFDLIDNGNKYDKSSLLNFSISILKRAKENGIFDIIKTIANEFSIMENSNIISNVINTYLNSYFDLKLTNEEKTKLSLYISELLKNLENSDIYKNFENYFIETITKINKNEIDSFQKLGNYLKIELSKFISKENNPEFVQQLFDILSLKNSKSSDGFNKFINILSALLKKDELIDLIIKKTNLKERIKDLQKLINLKKLPEPIRNDVEKILNNIFHNINEKWEDSVLPKLKSLIKKSISNEKVKQSKNITEFLSSIFNENKEKFRNITEEILNNLILSSSENKESLANIISYYIKSKLNNLTFENDEQKQELRKILIKVIDSVSSWNIANGIINSFIDSLVKNINNSGFEFKKFEFNNLINFKNIINNIDIDKVVEFLKTLESKDLSNIIIIFIKNFENFEKLFELQEQKNNKTSTTEKEINNHSSLNFETLFKLIKTSLSILNKEDRDKIKALIPELTNKILNSKTIKDFIKNKLLALKEIILKENEKAEDFASATIEKIIEAIFGSSSSKNTFEKLIISFIDLDETALNTITDINSLIKKLLDSNKNNLDTYIKEILKNTIKNEEYTKKLIAFILEFLTKKYKLDSTSDEIINITSIIWRTINTLENDEKTIITDIVSNVFNSVIDSNLFDKQGKINKDELLQKIISTLKTIDFKTLFNPEIFEKLSKNIFTNNLSKEELKTELNSLFSFLSRNIPKLKNSDDKKEDIKNIEILLSNLIIGLSNSLQNQNTSIEVLSESIYNLLKKEIENINFDSLKQNIISNEELKLIIRKLIEKKETKKLIDDLIKDFLSGSKISETNTLGETINKLLSQLSNKLKENSKNIIKSLIEDKEIIGVFVNVISNNLKLKNLEKEDKQFLNETIIDLLKEIIKTDYFERKIVKRSFDLIINNSKNFELENPIKWILDAVEKIKAGFSLSDAKILSSLIGENKPINGAKLVRLVNLIFDKSDLHDSIIYNTLRNINMDSDKSKRTNMKSLNDFINLGGNSNSTPPNPNDPDNINPDLDPLVLINEIFKILWVEFSKSEANDSNKNFKIRSKTAEWKAIYRIQVSINFIIFEMFGRETLEEQREKNLKLNLYSGTRALLWELQEGTNLKWIPGVGNKFSGMNYYFKNKDHLRQFTNYLKEEESGWFSSTYHYFEENNYGPESINYIIISSGYNESEKNKLKDFKFKVSSEENEKPISKKEYILLTLKEGGYGKFMALNDRISTSRWSGLNKVKKEEFY